MLDLVARGMPAMCEACPNDRTPGELNVGHGWYCPQHAAREAAEVVYCPASSRLDVEEALEVLEIARLHGRARLAARGLR